MSLTHLMLLSLPGALLALKLAVLALATIWALSAVFRTHGLLPGLRSDPLLVPVRAPRSRRCCSPIA